MFGTFGASIASMLAPSSDRSLMVQLQLRVPLAHINVPQIST